MKEQEDVAAAVAERVIAFLEDRQSSRSGLQGPNLLSVGDVAQRLSISIRTVEDLIADEKLVPIWVGGQRRFHPKTIEAFIRACPVKRRRRSS